MHWSPDTFLIKLRLLSLLHQNKTFQFFNAYYASELCVLTKNVNKVLPIPSLPECIICRRQLGYHSKNVDETFQNCQIIGQWLSDRNVKNGLLCTAKRILERRGVQTSSLFVKIWLVCIPESKANFLFSWHIDLFIEILSDKIFNHIKRRFVICYLIV